MHDLGFHIWDKSVIFHGVIAMEVQVNDDLPERKERILSSEDAAREREREYQREWYQTNKAAKDAKSKAWRDANVERSREIGRASMKRANDAKAIAEGREPGRRGRPSLFTPEEKRAKRKAKTEKWNAEHIDEVREKARLREAAKRAGTFVSRALPRLTDEQRRLTDIAWASTRRTRIRQAGGKFTREDLEWIMSEQESFCLFCALPLGDEEMHVDHWIPVINGGPNVPENLALLHGKCNLTKGAHMPSEFGLPDTPRERRDALKLQRNTEGKNT